MRYPVLIALCILTLAASGLAQENVTITTFFPSPFGTYNDLNVHNQTVLHGTGGNATIRADAGGNLSINSTENFPQLMFDDVDKPFSYLLRFTSTTGVNYCARGYAAVGFLDDSHIPIDPADMPESGYVVCLRTW